MSSQIERYHVPVLKHHVRYHAFITHCEADLDVAKKLLEQIEQHNFRCVFAKRDFNVGAAVVDNIANAISSSRRTVLVISKASLRSQWCKYEMLAAVDDTNRTNRISFIPVLLHDVTDEDLPHPLRFVTYIHAGQDKDYLHKLLRALAAPDEDWEDHIPAGNVAHGLAWSYYFGYLKFLLPGMDKRITDSEQWKTDSINRLMCKKILLLYPSSCHCCLRRLDEDPSGRITHEGEVELLMDRAGVVGRVYKNTVYSVVSKEGKKFYFVGEYVTCIRTMYEMEKSGIAGLKHDDTRLLSTKFLITIKQILDRDKDCTHMYRIIFYEDTDQTDKTTTLPDHIVNAIQEEILEEVKDIQRASPQNKTKTLSKTTFSQEKLGNSLSAKLETAEISDRKSLCTESSNDTTHIYPGLSLSTCETESRNRKCNKTTDGVDPWNRQHVCDYGLQEDRQEERESIHLGNEIINIF